MVYHITDDNIFTLEMDILEKKINLKKFLKSNVFSEKFIFHILKRGEEEPIS